MSGDSRCCGGYSGHDSSPERLGIGILGRCAAPGANVLSCNAVPTDGSKSTCFGVERGVSACLGVIRGVSCCLGPGDGAFPPIA